MVDRKTPKYRKIGANAQISHRMRRRRKIHDMKKGLECVYCGAKNPLCLDFDHIDRTTKKGILATMITNGTKWDTVMEEINKCQTVCANCHRIKTILESDKMKAIEEGIIEFIPEKLKIEFNL